MELNLDDLRIGYKYLSMHVIFRLGVLDVCQIICGLPFVWRGVLRRFLALPDGFVVKFVQANFKDHS